MAGCGGQETRLVSSTVVNVGSLGELPESFSAVTNRFDIDARSDAYRNHHNEGRIVSECARTDGRKFSADLVNDSFSIRGEKTDSGYKLRVIVNSEANILFWNGDVTSAFEFDEKTGKWSWNAMVREKGKNREYAYCAPEEAFETLMAGIQCYIDTEKGVWTDVVLEKLTTDIKKQRTEILAATVRYNKEEDCNAVIEPPEYDYDTIP